jgi:hypothetical protein
MDYLGKKAFPSVTQRDFLSDFLGGPDGCKLAIDDWVKYKKDLGNVILE